MIFFHIKAKFQIKGYLKDLIIRSKQRVTINFDNQCSAVVAANEKALGWNVLP